MVSREFWSVKELISLKYFCKIHEYVIDESLICRYNVHLANLESRITLWPGCEGVWMNARPHSIRGGVSIKQKHPGQRNLKSGQISKIPKPELIDYFGGFPYQTTILGDLD